MAFHWILIDTFAISIKNRSKMEITKEIRTSKNDVIQYFRDELETFMEELEGENDYKNKAKILNRELYKSREGLIKEIEEKALEEEWSNIELLECILMVTYCNYVVMLEARNSVWSYEYMTFSRRIGELWEPFCKLTFKYPINELELFTPPTFQEIKNKMLPELTDKINNLPISDEDKEQLLNFYSALWEMVSCGEIQMNLDLHFKIGDEKFVVDFKSGFGSNEKGNTNRLLLVAKIFHGLNDNYNPLIFVRSTENNNYFNTLKNSGLWSAFSGADTYNEIQRYTGYNIKQWIENNISWEDDLSPEFVNHLRTNNLLQYLTW